MRKTITTPILCLPLMCLLWAGCDDDEPNPALVAQARSMEGSYQVQGRWDLSGPLQEGETIGELSADLLVELAVNQLTIPSSLKDEARSAVRAVIHRPSTLAIDALLPELAEASTREALSALLANLEVSSTLTLTPSGERLRATETITAMSVETDLGALSIPSEIFSAGEERSATLSSEFIARPQDGGLALELDRHEFSVRGDRVALWLLDEVVLKDVAFKTSMITDKLNCDTITGALEFDPIRVAGINIGLNLSKLNTACAQLVSTLESRALGLFSADSGVQHGGRAEAIDEDSDGQVDRLESTEAYSGEWTVVLSSVSPQLAVEFEADRAE